MGKQSQLLLKPTEVELGLQVRVEFDKRIKYILTDCDKGMIWPYRLDGMESETQKRFKLLKHLDQWLSETEFFFTNFNM